MASILKTMADCATYLCHSFNICPLHTNSRQCPVAGYGHKDCSDIEWNDWIFACSKDYGRSLCEVPPFERKPEPPKMRSIKATLYNGNKQTVCTSTVNSDRKSHEKMEADCKKNLISTFRHKLAIHNPAMSEKTEQEIEAIMDALVALEGYTIEWESSGRD